MEVNQAYDDWASQYDTNINKTRDLEAVALRETLADIDFKNCLEIGCGTGKNTAWLVSRAQQVTAVDFSAKMLAQAKNKVSPPKVVFIQADIINTWSFEYAPFDLISFSLVLEHIENLDAIFQKAAEVIQPNGYIYLGELHPFKQYTGTKARFETESGRQEVTCYNHHLSDFTFAAKKNGFEVCRIQEFFDEGEKASIPRIISLLFKKPMI